MSETRVEVERIAAAACSGRMGPSAVAHEILTLIEHERSKVWHAAIDHIIQNGEAAHDDDEGSLKFLCEALAAQLRELSKRGR